MSIVEKKVSANELIAKVQDKRLPVERRLDSVRDVLIAYAPKLMQALPKHITPDRMCRVALSALRTNPALLDCTPASLFNSIAEAATYGWEIGGVLSQAYLVPYKDECKLIPGYKGLIDLCRRSGQVSTITLEVVHAGDAFDYTLGDDARIIHKPASDADRTKRPVTFVYASVRLRDGGIQRSVWSASDIEAHKVRYSQSWKRAEAYREDCVKAKRPVNEQKLSPWHTAWAAMAKKTVIRDMIGRGLLPLSAEVRDVALRGTDEDGAQVSMLPPAQSQYEPLPAFVPKLIDDSETDPAPEVGTAEATPYKPEDTSGAAWDTFVTELEATEMVTDVNKVYDAWFGPDAAVQFSEDKHRLAAELKDAQIANIKSRRGGKR